MEKTCDIVIVVWNQRVYTEECLESILAHTVQSFRIILVDNASDAATREYLREFARAHPENTLLIRHEKNYGFVKGANIGMRASRAPYVCLLNNDTRVADGWLEGIIGVLERFPEVGIVNPSSNTLGQKLSSYEEEDLVRMGQTVKSQGVQYERRAVAHGFCMTMRKSLIDEIGMFDERFGRGFFEDLDFSLRAKTKGYTIARALSSYVYHREHASFKLLRRARNDFDINKRLFETRWGRLYRHLMIVRKPLTQHPRLRELLEELVFNGSSVTILSSAAAETISVIPHVQYKQKPRSLAGVIAMLLTKKKKYTHIFTDDKTLCARLRSVSWCIAEPSLRLL